jgi:hypothetical protein
MSAFRIGRAIVVAISREGRPHQADRRPGDPPHEQREDHGVEHRRQQGQHSGCGIHPPQSVSRALRGIESGRRRLSRL